jgi:hypothetical protein
MRVNLTTHSLACSDAATGAIPLSLTIRPACGMPGDYQFPTDSAWLMELLREKTSLPEPVLERFERKLNTPVGAKLLAVELSDKVLTDIGYFVD